MDYKKSWLGGRLFLIFETFFTDKASNNRGKQK